MAEYIPPVDHPSSTATTMSKPSFSSLSLELRHIVYHLAATDLTEEREIRVKFTLTKDTTDGSGEFEAPAPALNLLDSLQQVSSELHREAIAYLTSPLFCWVFVSETQPHMYLIRALRKHAQGQILGQIRHVRLEGVAVMEFIHPGPSPVDFKFEMEPAYLSHSRQRGVMDGYGHFRYKVLRDIGYGLSLLPYLLRSLRRLDLHLDIIDCLTFHVMSGDYVWNGSNHTIIPHLGSILFAMQGMINQLIALGNIRKPEAVDVHILWKDTGLLERLPLYHFSEESQVKMQKIFIEALKKRLVAKSITGHR